jgi:hypothetical protein
MIRGFYINRRAIMRRVLKELVIIIFAIIAGIYLLNPTAGFLELLPDNLPLVGNLDEAGAVAILVNTFGYYGFDVTKLYGRKKSVKKVRRIVRTIDGDEVE